MTNRAKTPKPSRRMESLNRYIAAGTSLNDAAKRLGDDRTAESFAELVKAQREFDAAEAALHVSARSMGMGPNRGAAGHLRKIGRRWFHRRRGTGRGGRSLFYGWWTTGAVDRSMFRLVLKRSREWLN